MSEYVLRTRDISKKYGNAYAIKNVSVEIKRGRIYGLIGLNGAGKTTFMRAVVELISLTGGELERFGQTGEKALQRGRRLATSHCFDYRQNWWILKRQLFLDPEGTCSSCLIVCR